MFGVGNEPTSVEQFNKYFPQEYYEFTDGEFIESKPTNVKIIGKNLFDISKTPEYYFPTDLYGITKVTKDYIEITTEKGSKVSSIDGRLLLKQFAPTLQVGRTYYLSATTNIGRNYIYLLESQRFWYFNTALTLTELDLNSRVVYYTIKPEDGYGVCRISNFQIEEGTTATDYAPYKESNLPINVPFDDLSWSVNNYGNYIDFENKKYVRQIAQYVFTGEEVNKDGSEFWKVQNVDYPFIYGGFNNTNIQITPIINSNVNHQICNKFDVNNIGSTRENYGIELFVSNIVRFRHPTINTPELLKAYLKEQYENGTPVILRYVVEATEEDISAYLPEDNYIKVEGNGNIVFENTNNTSIPSEVEYLKSVLNERIQDVEVGLSSLTEQVNKNSSDIDYILNVVTDTLGGI